MKQPTANQIDSWFGSIKTALNAYIDKPLTHNDLEGIAVLMGRAVRRGSKVSSAAVSSMSHLEGKTVSIGMLNRNVRRVLANWNFIDEGSDIPDWDGTPVTTDAVVLGVRAAGQGAGGRRQYLLALKLKTGLVAGLVKCAVETDGRIDQFLSSKAGVSKMAPATEDIAGMRARITIEGLPDVSMVKVQQWDASENQRKLNKDLEERRADVTKCSKGIQPCNTCRCNIRECPLAVWLEGEEDDKVDICESTQARGA